MIQTGKKRLSVVLTVLLALGLISAARPSEAYAFPGSEVVVGIDTGTGVMTFFRSDEPYENGETDGSVTYFTGIETTPFGGYADYVPWYDMIGPDQVFGEVTKVVFETEVAPLSTAYWFYAMENLETIEGMDNLDTSNVTSMDSMFYNCAKLDDPDLSHFDVSYVTDFDYMFGGCAGMTVLDLSSFENDGATTMRGMFYLDYMLEEIDLSGFSGTNVVNMQNTFYSCASLKRLDLSCFDTTAVAAAAQTSPSVFSNTFRNNGWLTMLALGDKTLFPGDSSIGHMTKVKEPDGTDVTDGAEFASLSDYDGSDPGWYEIAQPEMTFQITETLTGVLDDTGTFSVCGAGAVPDYRSKQDVPWASVINKVKKVMLGEGVTGIGNYAFYDYPYLTEVTIPASVSEIRGSAMAYNSRLKKITVAEDSAYYRMIGRILYTEDGKRLVCFPGGLTDTGYIVQDGTETIGDYAFYGNYRLAAVGLPASVTAIEEYGFSGCAQLKDIDLGGIGSFGKNALSACTRLESADLSGLTDNFVPEGLFAGCGALKEIQLPDTVKAIGTGAFDSCFSLDDVALPEGLIMIGDQAFSHTALTEVTVPTSTESIGADAFSHNYRLEKITVLNPSCMIDDADMTLNDDYEDYTGSGAAHLGLTCVIFGYLESTAETYAKERYRSFIALDGTDEVTGVSLEKKSVKLGINEGMRLFASVLPENAADKAVSWKSSDPKTVSVDAKGWITALKYVRGRKAVTVTARSRVNPKIKASCKVTVLFPDVMDKTIPEVKSFYEPVYWAADNGITSGYTSGENAGKFGIMDECTRGQAMVFLWRLAGKPAPKSSEYPFSDVPENATYKNAIIWAVEKKITNGYTTGDKAGTFGVDEPCTRGQIMVFLWRYKGKPAPKADSSVSFTDMEGLSAAYVRAIRWGASCKITGGYTNEDGTKRFEPDTNCTRGHIVTFLYRAKDK